MAVLFSAKNDSQQTLICAPSCEKEGVWRTRIASTNKSAWEQGTGLHQAQKNSVKRKVS